MDKMKVAIEVILRIGISIILIAAFVVGCQALRWRNLEVTRSLAPDRIAEYGFEKCTYDGFSGSIFLGAQVWYTCEDNGRMFSLFFAKWGDDALQMYQDYDNMTTVPNSINLN